MNYREPAIKQDTFAGDLANALLLRPVYRKPKEKKMDKAAIVKEQIHTKIEEFRETIDPLDFTMEGILQRIDILATIKGLQLALQIIEENEDDN